MCFSALLYYSLFILHSYLLTLALASLVCPEGFGEPRPKNSPLDCFCLHFVTARPFRIHLDIFTFHSYLLTLALASLVCPEGFGEPRPKNSPLDCFCLHFVTARPFRIHLDIFTFHSYLLTLALASLVCPEGFEPPISKFVALHSIQLNYGHIYVYASNIIIFYSIYFNRKT